MASNTRSRVASKKFKLSIVMLGECGVGKSCSLAAFGKSQSSRMTICRETVGLDFTNKSMKIDEKEVTLHIWDTSGQEKFDSVCSQYYRNADGIVLMYDVTKRVTFNKLSKWWEEIIKHASGNVDVIVVGNKIDLENREVTRLEGLKHAKERKALFIESTSTDGEGICHLFEKLIRKILTHHISYLEPDVVLLSPDSYDVAVNTKRNCWEKYC